MCFLPSRSFPDFEIVSSSQFVTIYRISLPSPARRVSMESQLPIDQSEKFSKIEQVAAPGPRASRSSACPYSKRVGQKLAPAPNPALLPPSKIPHPNLYFLKGVDITALKGGREGRTRKITCIFNFGQNYANNLERIS